MLVSRCRWHQKTKLPQHEKCHCTAIKIPTPVAGKNAIAYSDIRKFTEYLLTNNSDGKNGLFEIFGYDISDSWTLQSEFEKQGQEKYAIGEYELGKLSIHGQRIIIMLEINRRDKDQKAYLTSSWLVEPKGKIKLITAY